MGVYQIEGAVGKGQPFPVRDAKVADQTLLRKVGFREVDSRDRDVDARHVRTATSKPRQVDAGATPDFEDRAPEVAAEVHQPKEVVQFLEVILIQIVEKAARSDRMIGNLEIVDVPLPVAADFVDIRHAG